MTCYRPVATAATAVVFFVVSSGKVLSNAGAISLGWRTFFLQVNCLRQVISEAQVEQCAESIENAPLLILSLIVQGLGILVGTWFVITSRCPRLWADLKALFAGVPKEKSPSSDSFTLASVWSDSTLCRRFYLVMVGVCADLFCLNSAAQAYVGTSVILGDMAQWQYANTAAWFEFGVGVVVTHSTYWCSVLQGFHQLTSNRQGEPLSCYYHLSNVSTVLLGTTLTCFFLRALTARTEQEALEVPVQLLFGLGELVSLVIIAWSAHHNASDNDLDLAIRNRSVRTDLERSLVEQYGAQSGHGVRSGIRIEVIGAWVGYCIGLSSLVFRYTDMQLHLASALLIFAASALLAYPTAQVYKAFFAPRAATGHWQLFGRCCAHRRVQSAALSVPLIGMGS